MPTRAPPHRPFGWHPAPKVYNPAHDFYGTERWKQLRAAVRRRDKNTCTTPGCGEPAARVDHIIPREQGGPDTMRNLRCLCATCDARRHPEKGSVWR
jgi:5-methylcytosine-specific restriction endonuclease McrA